MTTQIALLRAINVAGHGTVAMSDLRQMLVSLGFEHVRSVLQSGNLVFRTHRESGVALEQLLETEAARRLGLRTDFLLRSAGEWGRLVERNPFPEVAKADPGHLVAMSLKGAPDQESLNLLQAAVNGPEEVRADGTQLYITYPDGIGRSRLTSSLIEAKLGTRGTARNWNTVLKIAELIHE